jgi:hypothetical protein
VQVTGWNDESEGTSAEFGCRIGFSAGRGANMRRSRWARLVYLIGLSMMGMSVFGEDRTMILATFIALGTVSDVRGDAGMGGDPAPCI